jgi:hypothetical protein
LQATAKLWYNKDMNTKTCRICKTDQPINEFRKDLNKRYNKIYMRGECRKCYNESRRNYEKLEHVKNRRANRQKIYGQREDVKVKNRERLREYIKQPHVKIKRKNYVEKYKQQEGYTIKQHKLYREYREISPVKYMLIKAKNRAKTQGVPFNLAESDISIPEMCPILGIPLYIAKGKPCANSPSLDKIIPELGYVQGNSAIISYKANRIKCDATFEEIEKLYFWMKSRQKEH